MVSFMDKDQLKILLNNLVNNSYESEWIEFKHNFHSAEEIGERISALANGACLNNQAYGYLVFGVEDKTHLIIGTTFKAKKHKKGSEDFRKLASYKIESKNRFFNL
jgi:ATP-dependent DNA helicase RecG